MKTMTLRRGVGAARLLLLLFAVLLFSVPAVVAADNGEEAEEASKRAIEIPARIAKAEVGEWASYRTVDGGKFTLTVVEKSDDMHGDYLVIRNEKFNAKGRRLRPSEEKVYIDDAVEGLTHVGPEDKVGRADVLVQGRSVKAVVISQTEKGEIVKQTYLSDKIPVYGLVQGTTPKEKTKTVLKIMDYGFAPESEEEWDD